MNATSKRAKAIFVDLIGNVPPLEWDARLRQVCDGDDALLRRVTDLLSAHVKEGSFLDEPAIAVDVTVDHKAEAPGTVIGPYKLLEQVGEGGMGVVFVAEQTEPIRRRVALKVIKPGMDTRQVIARFEAERQALAMMDHPNIARVLDAGTTEAGRPYFVMELVRGMPITEYCDKARLSPRGRLELFVDVCQAVKHAHQKGIIHRDLKPSNVLITLHDGTPVVKVIDFGVAKAVGQHLTERTLYTALTQLVGTPLYMSPEQAEMSGLDVDTRSDVYSLGVLLYELLTGQTPFDRETLARAGLDEIRRIIREDDPLRPSRRFSSLGAQASSTISQHRGLDERRLSKILCGELDWIVMKSLEKDRSRRYESASAFATDVQRYLDDEPVLACPPSTMYKFHKFARKHRASLATAVAIAASLILGTTASAWQAVRATTAEAQANANAAEAQDKAQEATAQRDLAQKQRDEVRALNDRLQHTLYASDMNLAQQAWEATDIRRVRELLERHRPHPGESDLRHFEWHYLNRLCHQELLTLGGGSRFATHVAYSPDGKRLASAGRRGPGGMGDVTKVWDAQTGRELLALGGAFGPVAFSPDGKRLATGARLDQGAAVKMWDAQTGQELTTFKGRAVYSVAFSPDGNRLACGSTTDDSTKRVSDDGEVKVWDVQTGRELLVLVLKGDDGLVSVAYSPDGKRLASTGAKPDGHDLADGAWEGTVKVWDAETGQEVFTVETPVFWNRAVAYSPDGKRLTHVSGSGISVSTITMWDAQTGRELLTQKTQGQVTTVAFSPDGKRLVTGAGTSSTGSNLIDRAVRVWDAETGQELYSLKGHVDRVTSVAFSPDGSRLASASRDGTVKVWNATTSQEARAVPGEILSPDGKHLAGRVGNEVKVWDTQTGRETLTFTGHTGPLRSVAFSPDGRRLVSAAADRTMKVWDTQTGRETLTLTGHTGRVQSVAFSPDGRRLVSAAADRTVKVWDAETGQELLTFKGFAGPVDESDSVRGGMGPVAFSPDGRRVAASNSVEVRTGRRIARTSELKVWDAQTGREVVTYKRNIGGINSVAFSPDGKRLASGADVGPLSSGEVKVWDAETGQELYTLPAGGPGVAFSPDGRRMASAGKPPVKPPIEGIGGPASSGEVKVWDAETGRELLTLQGHTSDVGDVAFSPDGQRLASGGIFDPTVRVWDTQTGQQLLVLKGQGYYLAFTPDGHRLASAQHTRVMMIWDATPLPEK